MSACVNLRYPDGVRSGSTSPCSSRNRIFEIVTSGKSGRSSARTAPMLSVDGSAPRRPAAAFTTGGSLPAARPAARVEHHAELADLDLVAVVEDDLVDAVTLHVGAVE